MGMHPSLSVKGYIPQLLLKYITAKPPQAYVMTLFSYYPHPGL
jgi:hypothetical protein